MVFGVIAVVGGVMMMLVPNSENKKNGYLPYAMFPETTNNCLCTDRLTFG